MATIHLIGICGTGMGSFAAMLKADGHDVRGSDQNVYPPMSEKLAAWGIEVRQGYRPENLDPAPDLVIVGNVIRRDNPEARAVVERGLKATSFPQALGEMYLARRHSVVVAGTHGKTTTTSMVAWLLTSAGRDPSLLVGGVPANFGEGYRIGKGEHFVVEGDEYDTAYFDKVPKFLHYRPRTAIVTSIEFDHADIYPDVAAIEREFDKLVALLPDNGKLIACASSPRVVGRLGRSHAAIETYTARTGVRADWYTDEVATSAAGSEFNVWRGRVRIGRFVLPMWGRHNVENAIASVAFAVGAGLSVAEIQRGLETFAGVERRQTVRAEIAGVRIVDDFAHHPTAVKETIAAIRARYPQGRLHAILEPRSATSARGHFQAAYAEAFAGADEVIIAGVGRPEIPPEERLDTAKLAGDVAATGVPARSIEKIDDIVGHLAATARRGDTLLFMSNGGFGGIYGKMAAALEKVGRST